MSSLSISDFADRLNELMPELAREFHKHHAADFIRTRLTLPQFVILDILSRIGHSKMTDLAHHLNVTTAAVTGIIDRLVRDSYVRRLHDESDRRIILVELTDAGTKTVSIINEKRRMMTIKMFSVISEKEREKYLDILTHVVSHLKHQEST